MKKAYLMLLLAGWFVALPLHADENIELSNGQVLYVPAYSNIYMGNTELPFLLTITLSIRNIDLNNRISITTVDYYETQGKLLQKKISEPIILNPLESTRYIIPEKDTTGGSGANFIVEWAADELVNPPIIEAVMVGSQVHKSIAFTSRGRVLIKSAKR